jgi:HEAT repeat protein
MLSTLRQIFRERFETIKEGLSTSIELRYRQDIVRLMQDKHITARLFSLNEIAIEPRLLAPPVSVIPGGPIPPENIIQVAVPYVPDRASVGAAFGVKTLSIPEAMSKGANLLIMGTPGSGKTFALSLFASRVAQRHPKVGEFGDLVPVFVHAGELSLPGKKGKTLDVLYQVLNEQVSTLVEAQLPSFLKTIFESKLALLIVDGLDELPRKAQTPIVKFVQTIQKRYPGNRYLLAASTDDISCHERLSLHPIPIAAWTENQKQEFTKRWGELWQKYVIKQSWTKRLPDSVDPIFLNNWLLNGTDAHSPLTFTLKTWALYSGDLLGSSEVDALEAYIWRMTLGVTNARLALEQLAIQMTLTLKPIIRRKTAGDYVAAFEDDSLAPPVLPPEPSDRTPSQEYELDELIEESVGQKSSESASPFFDEELEDLLEGLEDLDLPDDLLLEDEKVEKPAEIKEEVRADRGTIKKRQVRRILPELVKADILVYRPDSQIGFAHPVMTGFLAGSGLASRGGAHQLIPLPIWTGNTLAGDFLAAKGDVSPIITHILSDDQSDPLKRGLLNMSNWPRYISKTASWRDQILRSMGDVVQQETLPLGLRTKVLSALAQSGEAGISTLFQQMLKSEKHSVRWLGALGCGLIRDEKSVDPLGLLLLYDNSIFISRVACLALVVIDTNQSMELIARALLEGSEDVRRAAAESLAHHPREGHQILKEGTKMEDLLVRRAVVFGLAQVKEPWAIDILEEMQVEESQWVVRNAATQALEDFKMVNPSIPVPMKEIHEIPWLISFASERGMGISPGQSGWDMLATTLREGNDDQRLAAMEIYRFKPSEANNIIPNLYQIMNGPEGILREAAYYTLWQLSTSGIDLPVPA